MNLFCVIGNALTCRGIQEIVLSILQQVTQKGQISNTTAHEAHLHYDAVFSVLLPEHIPHQMCLSLCNGFIIADLDRKEHPCRLDMNQFALPTRVTFGCVSNCVFIAASSELFEVTMFADKQQRFFSTVLVLNEAQTAVHLPTKN